MVFLNRAITATKIREKQKRILNKCFSYFNYVDIAFDLNTETGIYNPKFTQILKGMGLINFYAQYQLKLLTL